MYVDALARFSDDQAITASAPSTDIMDLGSPRNIGVGEELYLVVVVTEAMVGAGTVEFRTETDDNSGFTSGTYKSHFTFPVASPAGTKKIARLNPGEFNEQFLRGDYVVAGGALTGGKFEAFLTCTVDAYTAYEDNITIS